MCSLDHLKWFNGVKHNGEAEFLALILPKVSIQWWLYSEQSIQVECQVCMAICCHGAGILYRAAGLFIVSSSQNLHISIITRSVCWWKSTRPSDGSQSCCGFSCTRPSRSFRVSVSGEPQFFCSSCLTSSACEPILHATLPRIEKQQFSIQYETCQFINWKKWKLF